MGCDLCGYSGELFNAEIEGSLMSVCQKCSRFGVLIQKKKDFSVNKIIKQKFKEKPLILLKENYSLLIKESRERSKLTQEDLAKKLNEKVSLIRKIENKELEPNEIFIKKLENFFKIKLTEDYKEEQVKLDFKSGSLTIGDLLKLKK